MADVLCIVDHTATTVQRRCSVSFDLTSNTFHEITPYSEVYGVHPRWMEYFNKHVETASCSFIADPDAESDTDDDSDDEVEDTQPSLFPVQCARHSAADSDDVKEAELDASVEFWAQVYSSRDTLGGPHCTRGSANDDEQAAIPENKSLQNDGEDRSIVEEGIGFRMSTSLKEKDSTESIHTDESQVGVQCGMHRNQRAGILTSELCKEAKDPARSKMTHLREGVHLLRQMFALNIHLLRHSV